MVAIMTAYGEKPTVTLGPDVLEVDTLFHAKIGPGTTQTQLHLTAAKPLDVFYLTVDLTTPGVSMHTVCPGGKIAGNSRTSAMAKNASSPGTLYFAGTNGDFYWTSGTATDGASVVGTPTYSAIVDGEVYKSSASGYQFSVDAQSVARVCRLDFSKGTATCGDKTAPVKGTNVDAINNAITLYSTRGWSSPCQRQFADACSEVEAVLVEGDTPASGGTFRVRVSSEVSHTGDRKAPQGGYTLMARGSARDFIDGLNIGDIVTINNKICTPEGEQIFPVQAVSGNPKMVGNGENLHSEAERGDASDRHPRTAIGYSADGTKVIMMVIDGRGASAGVTTGMLGDMMIYAGAAEAVNLDGGGSSTLYTSALGVRNRCSDGSERAVGNAIFAVVNGDTEDTTVAELQFADWRFDLPLMGLYTPRIFAFNAAGVLIDTDFKDYTLSCPNSLGQIINDGKTLFADGNNHGVLTASYNGVSATLPVYVTEAEMQPRLQEVIIDDVDPYEVEIEAVVMGSALPIHPAVFAWTSSNPEVASVDQNGIVRGLTNGEAIITGTNSKQTLSVPVKVQIAEQQFMPLEADFQAWEVKKSLISTITATAEGTSGVLLEYTMGSSTRGPKITLTDKKNIFSRPDGLRIVLAEASAIPSQLTVTFRAANMAKSVTSVLKEFNQDGATEWFIPFEDFFDLADAAAYPVEFTSLAIEPSDAAKAEGRLLFSNIEVKYNDAPAGIENISVDKTGIYGADSQWYTVDGVRVDPRNVSAGIYVIRTAAGARKVIVK